MSRRAGLWRSECGAAAALLLVALFLPAPVAQAATDPETNRLQQQAEQLEKENRWPAAAKLYRRLAELQPSVVEWTVAQRRCQQQQIISRRYLDPSFRDKVLSLSLERASDLYLEVLAKIEANFITEVNAGLLFQRGIDNLDLALRNRAFLNATLPRGHREEKVTQFRDDLRQKWTRADVRDSTTAVLEAQEIARRWQVSLGGKPSAVIAELACAACEALDAYSGYLTPDGLAEVLAVTRDDLAGTGMDVQWLDDRLMVAVVLPDGPAFQAGLHPGDTILKIEGTPSQRLTNEEIALRLLGKPGSRVTLEVQASSDPAPRQVEVLRQPIHSILASRLVDMEAGIGYIHLGFFQKGTPEEIDHAITELVRQGMHALILDLRRNPGGDFAAALDVADKFISTGSLAHTHGRAPGTTMTHRAQDPHNWTMPLVVLIDNETASAGEVLAGAIKDNGRGFLVGQKTYGKNAMQQVFPLATVPAGVRLTTARFFSPLDLTMHGQGVTPHLSVERVEPPPGAEPMMMVVDLQIHQFQVALQAARDRVSKP